MLFLLRLYNLFFNIFLKQSIIGRICIFFFFKKKREELINRLDDDIESDDEDSPTDSIRDENMENDYDYE